tara:strand:- start:118 stop:381 length:264 start_codon:yes stop_codon:yes gene_type:complete
MDKLIVKEVAIDEEVVSGFIIPNTDTDKPMVGMVIAAGPGVEDKKMSVKTGDKILYGKGAGAEIEVNGETLLILREPDVYVIIKEDD